MIKPKGWIDDIVVYPAIFGQKATLSSMNELNEIGLDMKNNGGSYIENNKLSPGKKAKKTGKWAKTMTKWLITYSSKGGKRWQLVSFEGSKGGES